MPHSHSNTNHRSEIHPSHLTAQSLATALIQHLQETGGLTPTTGQPEHDCPCPTLHVEVVVLSENGHTHVHIHCPPSRQIVFLRTNQPHVIQMVELWCQLNQLTCAVKRA